MSGPLGESFAKQSLNREVALFLDGQHIPASKNNFTKMALSWGVALFLCADGTVLSMSVGSLPSPVSTQARFLVPVPLDSRLWLGGQQVVDVATGQSNAAVLLSNGYVAAWDAFFDQLVPVPNSNLETITGLPIYNDTAFSQDPLHYSRAFFLAPPAAPIKQIFGYLSVFAALDVHGSLLSFGPWVSNYTAAQQATYSKHSALVENFGPVEHVALGHSVFWAICNSPTAGRSLILATAIVAGANYTDIFDQNTDYSLLNLTGSTLNLSDVTAIRAHEHLVLFVTSQGGVYGYLNPLAGTSNLAHLLTPSPAYPIPLPLSNMPPPSQIIDVAIMNKRFCWTPMVACGARAWNPSLLTRTLRACNASFPNTLCHPSHL